MKRKNNIAHFFQLAKLGLLLSFSFLFSLFLMAGDDPCSATPCSLSCGSKIIASNLGMNNSGIATPSCGDYQGGDIWFSAVVPSTGIIEIQLVSRIGGINDIGMAMYTAPDCAGPFSQIDCSASTMPYIIEDNLNPGTTIYFRVWENGNDQTGDFEIEIIDPNDVFCLNDDAIAFNFPADTCMQTTSDAQNEKGCAWYRNTIDFSQDFDEYMLLFLGDNNSGADGMTVVFHNDPVGTVACGSNGQGMGALGINNALVIEVDTYDNGSVIEGGGTDFSYDHIALWTSNSGPENPIAGPTRARTNGGNIEDNQIHLLQLDWTAATNTMNIYFDGILRITYSQDFVGTVFGSKNVFWGSTGATGFFSNQQYLCPFIPQFTILPIELSGFRSVCDGNKNSLKWTTLSEVNNEYFSIEKSANGIEFTEVDKVAGHGNSSQSINYQWSDIDGKACYYRLKQVDFDGQFEYSEMIYVSCDEIQELNIYPNPSSDYLKVDVGNLEIEQIQVFNNQGRLIMQGAFKNTKELDIKNLTPGLYQIRVETKRKSIQAKFIKL